jgi:hypothetical protein
MLLEPISEPGKIAPLDPAHIPVEIPSSSTTGDGGGGRVTIPAEDGTEVVPTSLEALVNEGAVWYIRANQGHTLKVYTP